MDINNLEDTDQESKIKKLIVSISGIILLVLILSYFLLSYPVFPILESLSESKTTKDNIIDLNEFSIIFEEEVFTELQENYHNNLQVEFATCLLGDKDQDYNINQIQTPEIIEQAFDHVTFKSCPQETLIVLHSHPYRRCIGSEQDMKHLEKLKEINKNALIIIMCEPNRFTIYS